MDDQARSQKDLNMTLLSVNFTDCVILELFQAVFEPFWVSQ